jgi:biotin carboxyl carrier protein
VEAMKMENEIRALISGTVKEIRVVDRQAVEKGELLAVIG